MGMNGNIGKTIKLDIESKLNEIVKIYKKDTNGRHLSYVHCRNAFLKYRNDKSKYDYLALHLFAYLGSWGMFRNSFFQQKDYTFLIPLIEILCKNNYEPLADSKVFGSDNEKAVELILNLAKEIKNYFIGKIYYKEDVEQKSVENVTDTLISKIILGTYGCIVAYDNNVVAALRERKLSTSLTKKSITQLINIVNDNKEEIDSVINSLEDKTYTKMKILDMYFFYEGMKIKSNKNIIKPLYNNHI